MKRWLKISAMGLIAAAQPAGARDDWYDPGLPLEGDVTVGTLAPGGGDATVHVRMKAPRWSLSWPSPYGQCRATLTLPPKGRKDDVYDTFAVLRVDTGGRTDEYRVDGDVASDDFNSLKIDYDGVTATLMVGDAMAREVAAVPFGEGEVSVSVDGTGICERMQLVQAPRHPEGGDSRAGTVDGSLEELLLRISVSEDLCEGVWEYYGKDADAAKVTVGGRYVIATAANGRDGYDIVYIAGGEENTEKWQPMMRKGRMRSTIFADDYDLEWTDASGMPVAGDTYARMSGDHSQLMFGFPDYGAILKFRRVRQTDVIRKAGL